MSVRPANAVSLSTSTPLRTTGIIVPPLAGGPTGGSLSVPPATTYLRRDGHLEARGVVETDGTGLRERLQEALGGAYALERELGGGGMSRVFVAEETRLRRRVVIKVLAPELAAGLLMDRFEREVRLAAGLQDPRIVPVLSAGDLAGLPYYTMPYVEGPSLRARLRDSAATGGPLGLAEAVTILRDVARALAYAHAHGVVHRDIKPENVLLAGDTAVVTDFGIAKALAAATTHAPTGGPTPDDGAAALTLTGLGMTLGTPAYMAPEQATGDVVDARADVYAWGVVAFELLAGRHPFAGKTTAPQLIAAQIGETPAPLPDVAPGVPPGLAALVMRCLAKDPASRPATAAELVTALGEWSGTGRTGEQAEPRRRHQRRWRRVVGGLGLALVLVAVGGWYLTPVEQRAVVVTLVKRPPPTYRVNRVVVAPFENETGDPRLAVLGSLAADEVTDGLSRLPNLDVVDAGTRMQTAEVLSRVPRVLRILVPADEQALAGETGAQVLVAGRYYILGDSLHFRARVLDAATGRVRTALAPVSGPAASPSVVVAALRARVVAALRAASGEEAEDLGSLSSTPPSLAAYEAFREGYQAFVRSYERPVPDSAIFQPLRRAIALDSTYGAPAVTLAFVAANRFAFSVADSALAHARRLRDRLSPAEQALVDLTEAWAGGDAHAAVEAAQRARIPQVTAYYALLARRPRVAITAFRATDPDRGLNVPTASIYWSRLAAAYAQVDEHARALDAAREGQRRSPRLRQVAQDISIAAARGDVSAVREGLEARWQADGPLVLVPAHRATTLLRTRGRREAEGRAMADLFAARLLRATAGDTSAFGRRIELLELLIATERWKDALRVADARRAAMTRDSAAGMPAGGAGFLTRRDEQVRRAVILLHVGHRAEALAIDSAIARTEGARWDRGWSAMARGVIAAHLGEPDRAVALLTRSVAQAGLEWFGGGAPSGIWTVEGVSLLLPLRDDPRFQALARPNPADDQ